MGNPAEKVVTIPGRDRLDKELCEALRLSREQAKRLIVSGRIRIGGVTHHHPARRLGKPTPVEILEAPAIRPPSSPLPFDEAAVQIVFEDEWMLAVNKPSGLPVHPGAGHVHDTLVEWLRAKNIRLANAADPSRAGLVHRLDKDTSGIILLAKEISVAENLMRQFSARTIEKEYRVVVQGCVPRRPITIIGAIARNPTDRKTFGIRRGGRDAVTVIEGISAVRTASYIRAMPKTGRTHQIRVHLKHAGFPIIGDPMYGVRNVPGISRMLLHAYRIKFSHPITSAAMNLCAPLPDEFVVSLRLLGFSPADDDRPRPGDDIDSGDPGCV